MSQQTQTNGTACTSKSPQALAPATLHQSSQSQLDLQVALQQLHEKFQPTALQDTETMAYVPVVGAFRIKLTDTVLLDVAMDDSTSGTQAPQA